MDRVHPQMEMVTIEESYIREKKKKRIVYECHRKCFRVVGLVGIEPDCECVIDKILSCREHNLIAPSCCITQE